MTYSVDLLPHFGANFALVDPVADHTRTAIVGRFVPAEVDEVSTNLGNKWYARRATAIPISLDDIE